MPFFAPGPCLLFALPPPEPCRNQHLHLSLSTAHKPERSLPRAGRSGGGFQLPVAPSVAGRYSDPNHPEGYRAIAVRGDGSATVVGSDRAKSGVEWTLPAEVSGIAPAHSYACPVYKTSERRGVTTTLIRTLIRGVQYGVPGV